MPEQMGGFPYWQIEFDEDGAPVQPPAIDALLAELPAQGVRDLFVFTHGWNNDRRAARELYSDFFDQLRGVVTARNLSPGSIGTAGVIWPSILWPDDAPIPRAGGAASLPARRSDADMARQITSAFTRPEQVAALEEMAKLLETRPRNDPAALGRFQQLLGALAPPGGEPEDGGDRTLITEPPDHVFRSMAVGVPRPRGAAAGIDDAFEGLWTGAKEALRATTYWHMKSRAGTVGRAGLGPLLGRIHASRPEVKIHLIGHSFGARVVSFALSGLPAGLDGLASPVKTLVLLQGAFSHFSFADALPFDPQRGGALKGMASRVDGPLLVTHSKKDTAVGVAYPKASFLSRADAASLDEKASRWGAMGSTGARAVNATEAAFKPVGQPYPFAKGKFLNLDGNHLIVKGGPPSGAHSDIVYPQIAWAVLSAAGVASP
jgi:hypothetical protein